METTQVRNEQLNAVGTPQKAQPGTLYVVPTPIGNLRDMTLRALDILGTVDVVYAEDTRVTGKLLSAYGIAVPLERLDEATMATRMSGVLEHLKAGAAVAYCSDAGMPGVSDPGMRLIAEARHEAIPVEILPGASAVITAYVASGTTDRAFGFFGFLPRKDGERQRVFESLQSFSGAAIFYDSPHRVADSVACLAALWPKRRVTLCRELTKLHEEVLTAPAEELAALLAVRKEQGALRGEIALVIEAPSETEVEEQAQASEEDIRTLIRTLLDQQMKAKAVARQVADTFSIPRNSAYDLVLQFKQEEEVDA